MKSKMIELSTGELWVNVDSITKVRRYKVEDTLLVDDSSHDYKSVVEIGKEQYAINKEPATIVKKIEGVPDDSLVVDYKGFEDSIKDYMSDHSFLNENTFVEDMLSCLYENEV